MNILLWAGTYCSPKERQFKRKKWPCPCCKDDVKAFTVPSFGRPRLRKMIFCSKCSAILYKPKRLYHLAFPQTEVTIRFEDGGFEKTSHDYSIDPYRVPVQLTHLCHNGAEVELIKYQRILKRDHGDEETLEQYYECPVCLHEKLLKSREIKITLLNYQMLSDKRFSLALH